jgi:outer membrane protein assembly factor BamB
VRFRGIFWFVVLVSAGLSATATVAFTSTVAAGREPVPDVRQVGRPGAGLRLLAARTTESAEPAGEWAQDGGSAARDGYQGSTVVSAKALRPLWTSEAGTGDRQIGGAALAGGVLWWAGSDRGVGELHRLDPVNGTEQGVAVYQPGRWFTQLAAVLGGVVVKGRGTSGGPVYLSRYTGAGTRVWDVEIPGDLALEGGFAITGSTVVASGGDRVRAYSVADGKLLWNVPAIGDGNVSGAIVADGLVVRSGRLGDEYVVTGLDLTSGAVKWRVPGGSGTDVFASGGQVFTTGPAGVCAFASATGARAWCVAGLAATSGSAAPGVVYALGDGFLAALSAQTGATLWRHSYVARGWTSSSSMWAPVIGNGAVYFVAYDFAQRNGETRHRHRLIALSAADGREQRRIDLDVPYEVGGEPLILGRSRLYFATLARVVALGAS